MVAPRDTSIESPPMLFNTAEGGQYAIDMKRRELQAVPVEHGGDGTPNLHFHQVVGVYVGSPSVQFFGPNDEELLTIPGPVVWTKNVPADSVTGEEGNLVVRTENSAYEFDQEQKLMRRLAGVNQPTNPLYPDGEWRSYDRIEGLAVGQRALIFYEPGQGKAKLISTIRDIKGTYIEPPVTIA